VCAPTQIAAVIGTCDDARDRRSKIERGSKSSRRGFSTKVYWYLYLYFDLLRNSTRGANLITGKIYDIDAPRCGRKSLWSPGQGLRTRAGQVGAYA
jgi:hypothetical protein